MFTFDLLKLSKTVAAALVLSLAYVNAAPSSDAPTATEAAIQNFLDDIHSDTDGIITDAEQKKIEAASKTSTVYGEMTVKGFLQILGRAKDLYPEIFEAEDVVFFDIGCGRGLVPIMFSLKTNFGKFIGLEIVDHRYQEAMQGLNKMQADYPGYSSIASKIQYLSADVLKKDLRKIVQKHAPNLNNPRWFIWMSSLCFPKNVMQGIVVNLEDQAPDGTVIFTSQDLPLLEGSRIHLIEANEFEMSWTEDSDEDSETFMYIVDKKGSNLLKAIKMRAEEG